MQPHEIDLETEDLVEDAKERPLYYEDPPGFIMPEVDLSELGDLTPGERDIIWTVHEVNPADVVFNPNIRAYNPDHVLNIALSMVTTGQRQECIGDLVQIEQEDGSSTFRIRVLGGQHRLLGSRLANTIFDSLNRPQMTVRIRTANRMLTQREILEIQTSENLQNPMTPAEEAKAIHGLYLQYKELDEKTTIREIARRTGRGEAKVANAIRFMELNDAVRDLVFNNLLIYSTAISLSPIPKNEQLKVAQQIILYDIDRAKAETLIKNVLYGHKFGTLFGDTLAEYKDRSHIIAFRSAADESARAAAGYFIRIAKLLSRMDQPEKAEMTEAVRDILVNLIYSSQEFIKLLEAYNPEIAQEIVTVANIRSVLSS